MAAQSEGLVAVIVSDQPICTQEHAMRFLIDVIHILKKVIKDLWFTLAYLLKELLLDIMFFLKTFPKALWHGLRTDWRERFLVAWYIFMGTIIWLYSKIDWLAVERWFR